MTELEQVVMTPKSRTDNSTTIIIERRIVNSTNKNMHVAGGEHTGIIVNKELAGTDNGVCKPAQLSLEFKVYLVDVHTGAHKQESRILRFWFRSTNNIDHASVAQDFFRELVSPQDFPRDYVGYIKRIMKLLQHKYNAISKVEVELRQVKDVEVPITLAVEEPNDQKPLLTSEKILEIIESAYPNPIALNDISSNNDWNETEVIDHLKALQSKGLLREVEHGIFTRQQSLDVDFKVVEQMPHMTTAKQPTIAIITAQYCEKLAVDAMIENKETFVRYTTIGESNVYTLGNIGAHRVVCTKLPSVGHTREAMTAAGSTTTRLLGTFQKVEYVFLVGLGGGVPHYTDYSKHVRLGDVVVSYPSKDKGVYLYCEAATPEDKTYNFEVKSYSPVNMILQELTKNLVNTANNNDCSEAPWIKHLKTGLRILNAQSDSKIDLPSSDTDKLYMMIGDKDLIEVAHPLPQESDAVRSKGCPLVHLSPVASGRSIVKEDRLRQIFASEIGALAFDCEYDAVIESIQGNCKDCFICIRGISDYKDGTKRKDWQPYASLAAASVMKAIISCLESNM